MENKPAVIRLLDKIIFGCVILFLVSTNNSIFVNQLGYYGALLCIIIQYFLGENKFKRTGLELAFALFIGFEIIAAIFSFNHAQAFNNVLRRFLLIPTVYTIAAAGTDFNRVKLFFKVYLGAALLTIVFYLGFAVKFFLANLYAIEGKGPSPFQYVMTAGGLISFTTIFFLAFLLNEKNNTRLKIFYAAGFLISAIALGASNTRAAWIGTAGAAILILVLKRKWFILAPLIIVSIAVLLIQNNVSVMHVYSFDDGKAVKEEKIATKGRASWVYNEGGTTYLSDYEGGILVFRDNSLVSKIPTPFPVMRFDAWKDSFYVARLLDQRLLLYKKTMGKMNLVNEFISPGLLVQYIISHGRIYLADSDSGLTVISDPENLNKRSRFPEMQKIKRISVDSTALAIYSGNDTLSVYKLSGGLPETKILSRKYKTSYGYVQVVDNSLFFTDDKMLRLFHIGDTGIAQVDSSKELQGLWAFDLSDGRLFAGDFGRKIYELNNPADNKISVKNVRNISFVPEYFQFSGGRIYACEIKRSRLGSIIDPYHQSNVERMNLWRAGSVIIREHPFTGVGDIDMQKVYSKYRDYYDKITYGHFHNNYVHLLVALGIPGFLIAMFLIIKILSVHVKIYRALKTVEFASSYALGAMASFVGFLLSGLAEWNFGDHEIITMVWFTLGLNLAFYFSYKKQDSADGEKKFSEENVLNLK